MASLSEIRARLQAQENKGQEGRSFGDGAIYPVWNIEEGQTASVRFLPDGNPENPFFWVEKNMIKLPFAGIKGGDNKPVVVQVPCMEMWGETCPILTEVRPWFKDKSLEEMGRRYWKKRSYLFQGFVRENPMAEDKTPENPIRRFIITSSVFSLVKAALLDPELDNLPTDYMKGLDFRITKTSKGGFADYSTSTWSRRESALTQAEQDALTHFGLANLADFLPKKPSSIEQAVIKEMFEASVDGQAYDVDKWAAYYRPAGVDAPGRGQQGERAEAPATVAPVTTATATPSKLAPWEEDVAIAEAAVAPKAAPAEPLITEGGGEDKAAAILALIRSRQAKTAAA
jgi:hypothetical protein